MIESAGGWWCMESSDLTSEVVFENVFLSFLIRSMYQQYLVEQFHPKIRIYEYNLSVWENRTSPSIWPGRNTYLQ